MNNIIIHIPKTGGTTLVSSLFNLEWQPKVSFNYRHISYDSKSSNSKDIFLSENYHNYKNYKIIMFIRDPFYRAFSEYNYIKNKDEFLDLFNDKIESFKDFIESSQNINPILNFLIGNQLYTKISNEDSSYIYNLVDKALNNLNFIIGKMENYNESMNIIKYNTNININKSIHSKRINSSKTDINEYMHLEHYFKEKNKFDYRLYHRLNKIFYSQLNKIDKKNIINYNFFGNKYDYILNYVMKSNLLRVYNCPTSFILKNEKILLELHNEASKNINKIDTENGIKYVTVWLTLFINIFKIDIEINYSDPLKTLEQICKLKFNIFIHIPKTGGSTFINILKHKYNIDTSIDNTHHINQIGITDIRHINFNHEKRLSETYDIFKIENIDLYKNSKIFTIIRHPIDRLISEYIFQRHILDFNDAAIINKLNPTPNTFQEYIKHKEVWNYQLKFLLGAGVADENIPNHYDLKNIFYFIDLYNIQIGITDKFDEFVKKFSENTDIKLDKNIDTKKLKKAPILIKNTIINSLTNNDKKYILETNELDYQLYLYAKNKN